MKPITGQYECVHSAGVGLEYFTARVDRLVLQTNGRFTLTTQDRSRLSNAAQTLISGKQVSSAAPETQREGNYRQQGNVIVLTFDDGTQEQGQLAYNQDGLQLGKDFFNKVSDSTLLPPTHRMKKDMEDIAKGLKIAGTIGGIAMKAAKSIHETIQTGQEQATSNTAAPSPQPGGAQVNPSPAQQAPAKPAYQPPPVRTAPPTMQSAQPQSEQIEALFCDQCGARIRPGKKFCNNCGARIV